MQNMEFPKQRDHVHIPSLFADKARTANPGFLCVSAPMVRYSKLEFRQLLRINGVDLCFTPMIVADSFNNSQKARQIEFTTTDDDLPIIAQFAAKNAKEFITSAQLIYPYVNGIDLNCGCPQTWAIAKGYGVGLLRKPEVVKDIIQTIRRTLPTDFSVSVKIRLVTGGETAAKSTIDLARQLEKCGITFLTIHGRTSWEKISAPLNTTALAEVKQSLQIPLVANGDVRNWRDAERLYEQTRADGIMAARGLLSNPTLFNPSNIDNQKQQTPLECVQQWIDIATRAGSNMHFQTLHHHLTFMCDGRLIKRRDRSFFNNFTKKQEVFNFLKQRFNLSPSEYALTNPIKYTVCNYQHFVQPNSEIKAHEELAWSEKSDGKFYNEFNSKINCSDDYNLEDSFFTHMMS